jgi:hydrogenase-4 component E
MFSFLSLIVVTSLLLSFTMLGSRWLKNYILSFAGQAWLMALISLMLGIHYASVSFYIVALVSWVLRGMILPYLFFSILKFSKVQREENTVLQAASSLLACIALVVFAIVIASHLIRVSDGVHLLSGLAIASMLSIVLIGFLMLVTRHQALSKIIALLMIENGLFLGGQLLIPSVQILIAMIVVFDVLIAVISFHLLAKYLVEQLDDADNRLLKRLVG